MHCPVDQDACPESYEVVEAARLCLRKSPYAAIRSLSCEYDHGVLVLRGRLSSFHEKQLAQVVIGHLAGVTQLIDEVEVTDDSR